MADKRAMGRSLTAVSLMVALTIGAWSQPLQFGQKRLEHSAPAKDAAMAGAFYQLGMDNLHEPSNSDRAIDHLEKAVSLDESNAEYHYMLAEAYMANYEYAGLVRMPFLAPKVKAQLELAVKCDPSSTVYREALVQYYVFAPGILGGSYQKAHEQANEIAKLDPYLGVLAHAGIFAEEGESDKAVTMYQKAIYSRPASWQAYFHFGEYHRARGEIDAAIVMFRKYVEVAPEQAESHYQLGRAYQMQRKYPETILSFQKAFALDPSRTPLVFRIAQLYEFMGQNDLAKEEYQRYLSMVPSGRAADDARVKIRALAR